MVLFNSYVRLPSPTVIKTVVIWRQPEVNRAPPLRFLLLIRQKHQQQEGRKGEGITQKEPQVVFQKFLGKFCKSCLSKNLMLIHLGNMVFTLEIV